MFSAFLYSPTLCSIYHCLLTSGAEVMWVHKCDWEGILCMQSALVGVTPVHGIHHVGHLLTGGSHGILAFLCQFAAQPKKKKKVNHLNIWWMVMSAVIIFYNPEALKSLIYFPVCDFFSVCDNTVLTAMKQSWSCVFCTHTSAVMEMLTSVPRQ